MPEFRFEAVDPQNQVTSGNLQAANADEAVRLLAARGYRLKSLQPVVQGSPVVRQQPATKAAPLLQPARAPQKPLTSIRTKIASDSDRWLIFSQLANLLKAGISPYEALRQIAARSRKPWIAQALQDASQRVKEGGRLSEALAVYVDLFPKHVQGLLQAGEEGGFLVEATELLANQCETAHRFSRFFWWAWFIFANTFASIPLGIALVEGLKKAFDASAEAWETGNVVVQGILKATFGPLGLLTLLIGFFLWGSRIWILSTRARLFRHRLALSTPTLKKRVMGECLSVFSWCLSRTSKAGLTPVRAWELSAAAVPNEAVSEQLMQVRRSMHEGSKLSDGMYKAQIIPQEYGPIIETGEMTGDVPGALMRVSESSRGEFESAQNMMKARAGCWGCLITLLTSVVLIGLLWRGFYGHAFKMLDLG